MNQQEDGRATDLGGSLKVVVIGAGAVASWLAPAIDAVDGYQVVAVASRTLEHAQALASTLQEAAATTVDDLPGADIYLISTSDDAIPVIAAATRAEGLWIHTSGSVPITALQGKERAAVLYPLQTFSRQDVSCTRSFAYSCTRDLDCTNTRIHEYTTGTADDGNEAASSLRPSKAGPPKADATGRGESSYLERPSKAGPPRADADAIPLFIEASSTEALKQVEALAGALSPRVYTADSEHRRALHIAAVFACNFTNRLWAHAAEILEHAGYPLDVLRPLLQATLDKAMAISPVEGQTGPARRGDRRVLESHLASLQGIQKKIYQLISNDILSQYNHPQL